MNAGGREGCKWLLQVYNAAGPWSVATRNRRVPE